MYFTLIAALLWLVWLCFCSVGCAIVFRRGLLLRLFGIDLVTESGAPASRLRVICRSLLTWSPLLAAPFALALLLPVLRDLGIERSGWDLIAPLALLFGHAYLFLAIWSALRPGRGLADVVAGTWPVPQ